MGRPRNDEKRAGEQEAFLAAFARTGIAKTAAGEAGLKPVAHYRWLKDDPGYAERFAALDGQTRGLAAENRKPHPRGYQQTEGPRVEKRKRAQEAVLSALAKSGIVMDAAAEAGIFPAAFYMWCRKYPEFRERAEQILRDTEDKRRETVAERVGAATRANWEKPGNREAWTEIRQQAWTSEMREAAGERARERHADPEFSAAWLVKAKASRPISCDNPSYFDVIDTPSKAYWLGFMATDGCVSGFNSGSLKLQVKLARRDRDHLVKLHKTLKARRPIRDYEEMSKPPGSKERKKRPVSVLAVSSHQIVNALVSHGITPRKSATVKPWNGPAHLMPHYWRGTVDGDGWICISSSGMSIGLCGTMDLVDAFLAWAHGVCGTTATSHPGPSGTKSNFRNTSVGGNRMAKSLIAALYDSAPVALTRKKALADLAVHGKPLAATLF